MTHQEKAKALYDKFYVYVCDDRMYSDENKQQTIECILICVDEMENELHYCNLKDDWCQECNVQTVKEKVIYWHEVKKEINKL